MYVKFRKPSDTATYNSVTSKRNSLFICLFIGTTTIVMYSHSCNKFDTATIEKSGNFIFGKTGKSDDILNFDMYNVRINY